MQTKQHPRIQERTLASLVAIGIFSLAILFVTFILPAVPRLMEKSYQQGIPTSEFPLFENIRSSR